VVTYSLAAVKRPLMSLSGLVFFFGGPRICCPLQKTKKGRKMIPLESQHKRDSSQVKIV